MTVPVENGHAGHHTAHNNGGQNIEKLDALIVGAGFAGIYLLHQLRKRGFKVKIVEVGSGLGGVWHWNRYPGARADTQYPLYAYSMPEVYKGWTWKTDYANSADLRSYFEHVDAQLDVKKDTLFHTKVESATFDEATNTWFVVCDTGKTFQTSFFIPAIGFSAKRYIPDWEGLDTFKGMIHHSSFWPKEGVDVAGKRVAVLGSGSTGVQITQEWASEIGDDGDLKMFQRTPNLCCPMKERNLTEEEQTKDKEDYDAVFRARLSTFGGFRFQPRPEKMLEASPEERQEMFEELWNMGGFRFLMNNYSDMNRNLEANQHAYDFWRSKTLPRINDPKTAELLAPQKPPHPFGAKRLALEVNFYEQFNRPNVHVVDTKTYPIARFVPKGIVTADGTLHELDVVAVATGFDGITGGLNDISIRGCGGRYLADKWKAGVLTYLGMTSAGFPNLFFTFGPQAPTAFSNGPTCVEIQGDWITRTLEHMRASKVTRIDAVPESEHEWKQLVQKFSVTNLRHFTASWYNGANIPGKVQEPLNFAGGIPYYIETLKDVTDRGYKGFRLE
ncbi:flavin-containing monooxygenase [Aspergillus puulaauensis]|uniref:FAD/NAD(P)-binding domain-containing protein n=1 Tax=Aspergillus puulaauensis TaxID=1220207 RepID=A0A7R7XSL7_9EURO|nr:uncharacterized protein APUU_51537A [Aspergillus puulaauensis]BCS26826.1 hypothetical protein APUU_51537A [Aspergillus puulaauensis]